MRKLSREDIFYAVVFLLAAIAVLAILLNAAVYMDTRRTCLAHGWRDAALTWDMSQYCIKVVDATELIVPLADILEN